MSNYYETYSHREDQYRYLVCAVAKILAPIFAPDGKTAEEVEERALDYTTTLGDLIDKAQGTEAARQARAEAHTAGHDAAVTVYTCMKSCYRSKRATKGEIMKTPKEDSSPDQTFRRMQALEKLWANLPNVPGGTAPLAAAGTYTKAGFTTLRGTLEDAIGNEVDKEQEENKAAGGMRELDAGAENFINAALVQGRSIYKEGTWQRVLIDAIPTEPSTQLPGAVTVNVAESPEAGEVHLNVSAAHATSYKIRRQGPGQPGFADVATILLPGDFTETGLTGGTHQYQIVPHNSRGDGPASEVVSIEVIAVGAPGVTSVTPPESQAPGEVHFQFTAEGATEFEVWEKGPGASVFTLSVTVPASVAGEGEYSASGRPPGIHDYKVRAVNPQGPGPFSAVVTLEVLEAAA